MNFYSTFWPFISFVVGAGCMYFFYTQKQKRTHLQMVPRTLMEDQKLRFQQEIQTLQKQIQVLKEGYKKLPALKVTGDSMPFEASAYNPSEVMISYHTPQPAESHPTFSSLYTFLERKRDLEQLKDTLTDIRGITPELAYQLQRIGVSSFRTIAEWSSLDIRRISASLELGNRIIEENWIVQAQNLCYEKAQKH